MEYFEENLKQMIYRWSHEWKELHWAMIQNYQEGSEIKFAAACSNP